MVTHTAEEKARKTKEHKVKIQGSTDDLDPDGDRTPTLRWNPHSGREG
jgi:hypothetical protein